jgi:hypothetical protein
VAGSRAGGTGRMTADLAGLGLLAAYLCSPGLFARAGLGTQTMSDLEEA